MQFVADGPDVPEELLQAHEEGRVVFFCGAGISYPAGLPGFKGLVNKIYDLAETTKTAIEQEAFNSEKYDAVLDLLERRIPGQRKTVRSALANALKPNLRLKGATDTHAALLKLARTRSGPLRLVTTNFDRLFDTAAKRSDQKFQTYTAPMLPIPKKSRWDGLVFLHGVLPKPADENALNRLVITSGDFGLAYLTERWAARFVSELFRNYIVCFIGYSINDPVLRYMMDALAADRMQGEITPKAWAFGDCEPGHEARKTTEWEAKGVTPILYDVDTVTHDHFRLHKTLLAWSETYRDGITGKKQLVSVNALARPSASTKEDNFVGRMLWALSDKTGAPARQFAEFNPAPPLEWLTEAFSHPGFKHSDLNRFGVSTPQEVDEKLQFSLVDRPPPHTMAPRMRLASGDFNSVRLDEIMSQLAHWLVRHLNDPQLILWIVAQGGVMHSHLGSLVEDRLSHLASLQRDSKSLDLKEIITHSPNAIPTPEMEVLWRILLSGRVKSPWQRADLYRWLDRAKKGGMTLLLRLELRELLAPKVLLKMPIRWGEQSSDTSGPKRIKDSVGWELALAANNVHSTLKGLIRTDFGEYLPGLVHDFEHLLMEALDLLSVLGEANERYDRSHWDLPSVTPHPQNRGFRDWVTLIELLRDAWQAIRQEHPARASQIAMRWFDVPYPTFKRLALYAASQDKCIAAKLWASWLTADNGWLLWTPGARREVLRLLVMQGSQLSGAAGAQLQRAILKGPPRAVFRDDIEPDRMRDSADRWIWLLLAKLKSSGLELSTASIKRLKQLSTANPNWRLSENERDEFSHWMSGTGDADFETSIIEIVAPTKKIDLIEWLKLPSHDSSEIKRDTWSSTCRKHSLNSLYALHDLSQQGVWPIERWREALRAWCDKRLHDRFWTHAAPVVMALPDHVLLQIAHSVSNWLELVSDKIFKDEDTLFTLCRRLMDLPSDPHEESQNDEDMARPVTDAINHPIGMLTQALVNRWFISAPHDNQGLPLILSNLFTDLTDTSIPQFRHGRVILSSHLISLFRVDKPWTEHHLLPLMNWDLDALEAKAVWEGFLWSPRLYQPLLGAFKNEFLQTTHHYDELGEHKQQFAGFFTYAAIGPIDGYSVGELRAALAALPSEGLEESAQALSQALESASDQREEYWEHRIQPFWQQIWPKNRDLRTARIAESLARLTIAAGDKFPSALKTVGDWLCPLEQPFFIVHSLEESKLCTRFPADALKLLATIADNPGWHSQELQSCLTSIVQASPDLRNDPRLQKLQELIR
ncbi:anti-phage defense-associated sirtuin Dsr1 [Pseudomonas sp. 1 R 17]|uniref:anti-phage defense-associated sirtuin Dsr1 n=1 Tax=Pseudomonas sp. 1 R 17 TaxID=1844091 RepID=UPI0008128B09|nr:anti-phage defense-associated sirtuin Dsr1 [Pseudomonas sp. 1 R 17]SAM35159.1 hypothetical protein BN1864_LIB5394:05206 [Pseudomonas sp. 1 R 17]